MASGISWATAKKRRIPEDLIIFSRSAGLNGATIALHLNKQCLHEHKSFTSSRQGCLHHC
jgi:hypothetical protein